MFSLAEYGPAHWRDFFYIWYVNCNFDENASMKSMLIAVTIIGSVIAGYILISRRKSTNLDAKNLSETARQNLKDGEVFPERSPLQTMG